MWLLDSACCNHMTSSYDVVPSHTSTSLPTIYEGTQPGFPFPNSGDPPGTPTDLKKKTFHFF